MDADKKLLEDAAKAAGGKNGEHNGLFYQWHDGLRSGGSAGVLRYVGQREWNPLEDDGDALRLAVKLHIKVEPRQGRCDVYWFAGPHYRTSHESGRDGAAAARRAIVRAAAEIGRSSFGSSSGEG